MPSVGIATGRDYSHIILTNRSSGVCPVAGEAKVTFEDLSHHPLPVPVSNDSIPAGSAPGPPAWVILEPGGSASEDVDFQSDGNPPPGQRRCEPTIAFIEITAPGGTTAHEFPFASAPGFCPHTSVSVFYLVAGRRSPS